MNVLIACEESQTVCIEFRKRGFTAFSADIQVPSGGHPEWHILGDVLNVLNGGFFLTMNSAAHFVTKWDLIIAHPPCTYLSNAGACRLYPVAGILDKNRCIKGFEGKSFFMKIFQSDCDHIAIENPIPSLVYSMPKYSQVIQPYEYGEHYSKKTCLWLKGLPDLVPTNFISDYIPYINSSSYSKTHNSKFKGFSRKGGSSKVRSKTFQGVAAAMAQQWGDFLLGFTDRQLSFFD